MLTKEEIIKGKLFDYGYIMTKINNGQDVGGVFIPLAVLDEINENLKSFAEKRIEELKQELNNL